MDERIAKRVLLMALGIIAVTMLLAGRWYLPTGKIVQSMKGDFIMKNYAGVVNMGRHAMPGLLYNPRVEEVSTLFVASLYQTGNKAEAALWSRRFLALGYEDVGVYQAYIRRSECTDTMSTGVAE